MRSSTTLSSPAPNDGDDDDDSLPFRWIFDPYALGLVALYGVLLTLSAFQLYIIFSAKHRKRTFQSGLLLLSILFAAVRLVFWIKSCNNAVWTQSWTLFIFLVPNILQFATFSLLAVYYAAVVRKSEWKRKFRRIYMSVYFAINVLFFLIVVVLSIAQLESVPTAIVDATNELYLAYLGCTYVLLAVLLAYYGVKFNRPTSSNKQLLPRSRSTFKALNSYLVACFIVRAVYALLNSIKLLPERQRTLAPNGEHIGLYWGVFVFYAFTDIAPGLSLVFLIWRVPDKQSRSFSGSEARTTASFFLPEDLALLGRNSVSGPFKLCGGCCCRDDGIDGNGESGEYDGVDPNQLPPMKGGGGTLGSVMVGGEKDYMVRVRSSEEMSLPGGSGSRVSSMLSGDLEAGDAAALKAPLLGAEGGGGGVFGDERRYDSPPVTQKHLSGERSPTGGGGGKVPSPNRDGGVSQVAAQQQQEGPRTSNGGGGVPPSGIRRGGKVGGAEAAAQSQRQNNFAAHRVNLPPPTFSNDTLSPHDILTNYTKSKKKRQGGQVGGNGLGEGLRGASGRGNNSSMSIAKIGSASSLLSSSGGSSSGSVKNAAASPPPTLGAGVGGGGKFLLGSVGDSAFGSESPAYSGGGGGYGYSVGSDGGQR